MVYDVAAARPGFSVTRVLQDAHKLDQINTSISKEPEAPVRRALLAKRNGLLEQYAIVRHEAELNTQYAAALDQYLSTVKEQAQIAGSHARAFVGYAHSQPEIESIGGVLKDQDLRQGVLDIVSKKNGTAAAERLKGTFKQADDALTIIDNLKGK